MTKTFRVGTFFDGGDPKKLKSFSAYTRTYNPQWKGCVEYEIEAPSGKEARRLAILHRQEHEIMGDPFEESGEDFS